MSGLAGNLGTGNPIPRFGDGENERLAGEFLELRQSVHDEMAMDPRSQVSPEAPPTTLSMRIFFPV